MTMLFLEGMGWPMEASFDEEMQSLFDECAAWMNGDN